MPDYAGFLRIGKLVSVLVSVWTPEPPKPLLHIQLRFGGEGRNRTGSGDFFKIHYSAITTPPPEANSLITNERQ